MLPVLASYKSEEPVDVTVSLPDDMRQRAKQEGLNLSRTLRDGLDAEFRRIDAMNEALSSPQSYEVEMETEYGFAYTGRITGVRIADIGHPKNSGIYLTTDKRVVVYWCDDKLFERLDDPEDPNALPTALRNWLEDPEEYVQACQGLGIPAVVDL